MIRKLFIVVLLTLVFNFTSVFGATQVVDFDYLENAGLNTFSEELDINGYYHMTSRERIVSSTLTLNAVDNFHYMIFFDDHNRVLGGMVNVNAFNDTGSTPEISASDFNMIDLGDITTTTVTVPSGAYSYALLVLDYDTYVKDKMQDELDYSYTITTDQTYSITSIHDTVYTANGNTYTLYELFDSSTAQYGGNNNLVSNGGFDDSSSWTSLSTPTEEINNGVYHSEGVAVNDYIIQSINTYAGHLYYYTVDVLVDYIDTPYLSIFDMRSPTSDFYVPYFAYNLSNSLDLWVTIDGLVLQNADRTELYFGSANNIRTLNIYYDNAGVFDLTELTASGDEPTAEQFSLMFDAWEWFETKSTKTLESETGSCRTSRGADNCSTYWVDDNITFSLTQTIFATIYNTTGVLHNNTETTFYAYNDEYVVPSGNTMFYYIPFYPDFYYPPDEIRVCLDGDTLYCDTYITDTVMPYTLTDNHFYGYITNTGDVSARLKFEFYYEPTSVPSPFQVGVNNDWRTHYWIDVTKLYGSNENIPTESEFVDFILDYTAPSLYSESNVDGLQFDDSLRWVFTELMYYDEFFTLSDLQSVTVSYDYTPVVYDRDVEDGVDTYLVNIGASDDTSKLIIGVAIMMIATLILFFTTKNGGVILIVDVLLYMIFSFMTWFPTWIAVFMGIVILLAFGISITKSNKGGE